MNMRRLGLDCGLLLLFMRFQFGVEHGTDESWELEVTLGLAGAIVDWGLRVGMLATDIGELFFVAGFVVVVELQGFFGRVVVGDVARHFHDMFDLCDGAALLGCEVRVLTRAFDALWLSGLEYLRGAVASLFPTVVVLQFLAFRRVFLEIAGTSDRIRLLPAFMDYSAFVIAVLLLAADNAVLLDCSVNLIERNL